MVTLITAAATYLTVPVLIRLLGLEGFGRWSLLEPIVLAGAVLILLGIEHGAIKQIAHDRLPPSIVVGRLMATALVPAALISAGILLGMIPVWGVWLATWVALLILAEGLLTLLTTSCRAADLAGGYALGQGGRAVLFLAVLVSGLAWPLWSVDTVEAVVIVRLCIVATLALCLAVLLRARLRWAHRAYGDAVHYGGFILLTGLLATVVEAGDRYVLAWFADPAAVGAYVIHVKLASIVGQGITTPFMLWFPVERFRHLRDADGGNLFFRTAAVLLLGMLLATAGAVWLAGPLLTLLMAPGVLFDPVVSGWILAATVAVGMGYPMNVGLLKPGLTHRNVFPSLLAAPISIGLAFALVPGWGMEGAAIAKTSGAVAALVILTTLSQQAHRVDFAYGRMIGLVGAATVLILIIDRTVPGAGPVAGCLRAGLYFVSIMFATAAALDPKMRVALLGLTAGRIARAIRPGGRERAVPTT